MKRNRARIEEKKRKLNRQFLGVITFVVVLVLSYAGLVLGLTWPVAKYSIDKAGMFGDSFGILTSLFSGLAFACVITAVWLQRLELELQSMELQDTREQLKNQGFESTFFQMLRLHNDILNSIDMDSLDPSDNKIISGRDCFVQVYERLKIRYQKYQNKNQQQLTATKEDSDVLEGAYKEFWNIYSKELGHYFRYLYSILKFVDSSDMEDKRLYSNLIRAQLSDHELLVLFYNSIYQYGAEFKPLMEKYCFFYDLNTDELLHTEHAKLYSESAFRQN